MFRTSKLLVLFLSLFILWGCSDDDSDNPVTINDPVVISLTIGLESQDIDLRDYEKIEYDGASAVQLGQLIAQEDILSLFERSAGDLRDHCVYRFYASDGFTPIERGRADLTWGIFQQGIIIVSSLNTYYPTELGLPGAYNVVELESIEVLPMVSMELPDTTFWYDLADFDAETVEDVAIISLAQMVPDSLIVYGFANWPAIDHQDLFTYRFHALDGFSPYNVGREDLTWDILQQGHMEVITRNTGFPEALELPGAYSTGNLASISLHRKLDVESPSGTTFYRIEDLETDTVTTQGEESIAISLADLVPVEYQTEAYTFSCYGKSTGISNTPEMSWDVFQNGYYLIEKDKTWFCGGQFADDSYRIRFAEGIRISQQ